MRYPKWAVGDEERFNSNWTDGCIALYDFVSSYNFILIRNDIVALCYRTDRIGLPRREGSKPFIESITPIGDDYE